MKTTILATVLSLSLLAPAAFASEAKPVGQEVLETLVKNSGQITLVSEEGTELQSEFQLGSLIASSLIGGYQGAREKGYLVLSDVSVGCKEGPGARGADQLDCNVNFMSGDFDVSKDGSKFEGPTAESSISFEVSLVRENGKLRLLRKRLKAFLAG